LWISSFFLLLFTCNIVYHQNLGVKNQIGPVWKRFGYIFCEMANFVVHDWLQAARKVFEFGAALVELNPLPVVLDLAVDAVGAALERLLYRFTGHGQHRLDWQHQAGPNVKTVPVRVSDLITKKNRKSIF
jgi:hypothetical protein